MPGLKNILISVLMYNSRGGAQILEIEKFHLTPGLKYVVTYYKPYEPHIS